MLRVDCLPDETKRLLEAIASIPEIGRFTLIGGTALALTWGHRRSEDLDFAITGTNLPRDACRTILDRLDVQGWLISDISDEMARIYAENDGDDLADTQQDWLCRHGGSATGVKLTFFADHSPKRRQPYALEPARLNCVTVMPPDGIFVLKSQLILRRTTSRDLFDLWSFLERGRTIGEILAAATQENPYLSYEKLRTHLLPARLPRTDPGLTALVDAGPTDLESLKAAISRHLDRYEEALAAEILANDRDDPMSDATP
ncbi:nucleotidyl transferase AbiEii/AbiGii toxin family protein [Azospirillum sp. B2RO_4]|uniref:nucleotidyl transferase AbiEii/AbiGii toxin family protein n=1 Tax=Azospirillum sp. B2RO_4 TaxID=3027796 RepID=UPI003DA898AF